MNDPGQVWQLFGMGPWVAACAVLTVALGLYSAVHYFGALVFLLRRSTAPPTARPSDGVAILIPARNEGPCAVRAIRSALGQDHDGPVTVLLLLKDREDTSLPFLCDAFAGVDFAGESDRVALTDRAHVVFTGQDPKHAKVNRAAEALDTPYVAILDCDHQADAGWIRTSMAMLQGRGARIVQGRREPLTAHGFFPLWDSLHQHIGCELFNASFERLGLTVFFTGTTVVMETALLQDRPLRDCITEDVDFSYGVVLDGDRIIANPHCGSSEEVSPDLYSFLARRRRWANGHTDAFFRHLPRLRGSSLRLRDRLQFLAHGVHYLVCAAVFALHLIIGLFFVPELPWTSVGAAALIALGLGGLVARSQRTDSVGGVLSELVVTFGWFFPAVVIAMNLSLAVLLNDLSRASLPIPGVIQILGLVGFVAPLVVLMVGLVGFRQLTPITAATVVVSYPIAFYLDICAVLFGLADCASRRQLWRAVARAVPKSPSGPVALITPRSIRQSWHLPAVLVAARGLSRQAIPLAMKPSRWVPAALLIGLFGAGVLYSPVSRIPVADAGCEVLEHDGDPWIVPAAKLQGYCQAEHGKRWSTRTGTFDVQRHDALVGVDPGFWDTLDSTFFCNQAHFQPDNVAVRPGGGVRFTLKEEARGDRAYTAGNIATKDLPEAKFLYGRFEAVLKPAKASGVLTAFFLYRFDPWQEIDAEFVGEDTSRMLLNVFYNPGDEGDLYNYGYRGTPVLVDLGFDASLDYHRYAIEWDTDEIRWFVDERLIHRRRSGQPTPIPHLPMRFHVNLWPTCSEELAGPLDPSALPVAAELKSVTISTWSPASTSAVAGALQSVLPSRRESDDWRDTAGWIQPGR